jgi:RNase H-fold protein (predicted Holliday junction resolvase)
MKRAIALKGRADSGKTFTISKVYELLKAKYPPIEEEDFKIASDIRVILIIKGFKIGIESQGDPDSRLKNSLNLFIKKECDVIVCATRTRGQTVEAVEKLSKFDYEIKWLEQNYVKPVEQDKNNLAMAKDIIKEIEAIILKK